MRRIFFLFFYFGLITVQAQGIYSEDFITSTRCRNFACFEDMMQQIQYTYVAKFSEPGVHETFECSIANDDGGRDMLNYSINQSPYGPYNELIFGTDRYYTYDALYNGLLANGFRKDSTAAGENGAVQSFFHSQLYPAMTMITQVFADPPEGDIMQYYINLQLFRRE